MWGKVKTLLLVLSLALNLPFIALWAANSVESESLRRELPNRATTPRGPASSDTTIRSLIPRSLISVRPEATPSVYREVGVTEEQWRDIGPRLATFRDSMSRLGREMKRQRDEWVDLMAAPELDRDAIRAKQDEILDTHRKMSDLVADNMLADREVLTPEQQTKFFKKLRDYCCPSATSSSRPSNANLGRHMNGTRSQ